MTRPGGNYPYSKRTAHLTLEGNRGYTWLRFVCEPELKRKLMEEAVRRHITLSEEMRRVLRVGMGMAE